MKSILFVCTGNVFRSLTAEYALKQQLGAESRFRVSSAGTRDASDISVRKDVAEYLSTKGLDVSQHQRTLVTADLLSRNDLVVAMNTDHQTTLLEHHGVQVPLYMEACGLGAVPLLDVDDVFPREDWHTPAALDHIRQIIDQIIAAAPKLLLNLTAGR